MTQEGHRCHVQLDQDGKGTAYTQALIQTGHTHADWKVFSKKDGMQSGRPSVMIKIGSETLITSVRQFLEVAAALKGCHPDADDRATPEYPPGTKLEKFHRGIKWEALLVEKMYLVSVDNPLVKGQIMLAGDEIIAKGLAEDLIDRIVMGG